MEGSRLNALTLREKPFDFMVSGDCYDTLDLLLVARYRPVGDSRVELPAIGFHRRHVVGI